LTVHAPGYHAAGKHQGEVLSGYHFKSLSSTATGTDNPDVTTLSLCNLVWSQEAVITIIVQFAGKVFWISHDMELM